jgi:hypothetical protein
MESRFFPGGRNMKFDMPRNDKTTWIRDKVVQLN